MNTYLALGIFIFACISGYRYRRVWKAEGPTWKLWMFGIFAAGSLLIVGLVPITY